MVQRSAEEITCSNLLICEGMDDVGFFHALIQKRKLPNFNIRTTARKRGFPGGTSRFAGKLRAVRQEESFIRLTQQILIVADNDDDPDASFKNVANQVKSVFNVMPSKPLEALKIGNLSITILMIPWTGKRGNLETFCADAAREADTYMAAHVDQFAEAAHVNNWQSDIRKTEMWLRCDMAARCQKDPFTYLGTSFSDFPELIPLDHKSFDQVSSVLEGFK